MSPLTTIPGKVARSQEFSYLEDCSGQHGCVACVKLTTADDDECETEGQSEHSINKLLEARVRGLDLQQT